MAKRKPKAAAKPKARRSRPSRPPSPPPRAKQPREQVLTGMEDMVDAELESLALDYVEKRDRRMEALGPEVDAKAAIKAAMHRKGLKTYKHRNIEIVLTQADEDVKVRVKPIKMDED